jgi:gustatory receptor
LCHFANFFVLVKFQFPTRGTREDFLYNGSFQEAVGFILAVAQFFGIMPVSGVRCKSVNSLKFKKFSIRFIWSIVLIVGLIWMFTIDIIWIYRSHVEFGKVIGTTFDITNLVSIFCFMELARKWPEVMLKWNEVEKFLPQLKYQMDKQVTIVELS